MPRTKIVCRSSHVKGAKEKKKTSKGSYCPSDALEDPQAKKARSNGRAPDKRWDHISFYENPIDGIFAIVQNIVGV